MTDNDFERLNALADKALNEVVTDIEIKEFNKLLTLWNDAIEISLFTRRTHCN